MVNKQKTGGSIVRRVDELGRVVLPKELRYKLLIAERDPLEIFLEDDMIILKPYRLRCVFCSNEDDLIEFKEQVICEECVGALK